MTTDQIERGIQLLTNLAHKVSAWSELNRISLNVKKTKAILFGSTHTVGLFNKLNVSYIVINNNGDLVPFVEEVISLGVILDSTLS